jgi:site-specific recombinase XerD
MHLPTIAIVFNRQGLKNKTKLYSVYIRITINRQSKYYKVKAPQKVTTEQWSGKENSWIKNTHSFAFEINNKIKETLEAINRTIKRYYSLDKPITFKAIEENLKKKGDDRVFNIYVDQYINNPPERLEEATLEKYRAFLKHLNDYNSNISFREISPDLVNGFKNYLDLKLKLQGSTIKSYFDKFKKIITHAEKENYLDNSQTKFLFSDTKIKVGKAKRTFLEIEEILKLKDLKFNEIERNLERDRDLFLFQTYTGYYYNDLKILRKDHLVKDPEFGYFIIGERDKNGNETIIPLFKFPNASSILNTYLKDDNDEFVFDRNIFIEPQAYNRNLKKIADKAGIKKNISGKVARHTNVQLWIRFGANRSVVSKMVGHTKEETTKHYFSVNIPEIIEGTKNIDFKTLGI